MEHLLDSPAAPLVTRRVFLSSTYVDLKAHRAAVRETLGRMEQFPVVMESFGAHGTGDATSVSLDNLRTAQVYVGIYAWRYGYVPPGETLSVTRQEYRAAANLPRYIFLADATTDADQGPGALFPAAVRDPDPVYRDALLAFRSEVGVQVVDFFTTPEDLASKVATALHRYLVNEYWQAFLAGADRRAPRLLPPRADGFIGRGDERAALIRRLRQGESVGVAAAVSGMGGVGKSALAAEVAHDLAAARDAFPAGIAWVRCDGLAGLDGLTAIYDKILAAWDAALPPEQLATAPEGEPAAALRERALRRVFRSPAPEAAEPGAALVLLDNVELELPLIRLLDTFPPLGVTLLLTMRHQPSGGLPLSLLPLDVLEPTAASELFAERYRARGASWDAARDRAATEESVELLGRLPLAIELAAARCALAGGGVAALAVELREADRLGRLRDPLDRERSVRYVLSRSLAGLTPTQRVRFAALGLPAGPDWPRDVIIALLAAVPPAAPAAPAAPEAPEALDAAPAEDDLDTFVALSLIAPATTLPTGESAISTPRLRMHQLLRDLAHEEWRRQPPELQDASAAALVDVLLPFVEQHKHDFAALAREEEMIAGAIHSATERHIAPKQTVQLVATLTDYLNIGGHWRLGMDLLQTQLSLGRAVNDRAGEGGALNNLGYLAASLGQVDEARRYYEQALVIRREVGDRAGEGTTLNNLGSLAQDLGQKQDARRYFEQALIILREVGHRRGEGGTLNNLGRLADSLGDKQQAHRYFEQALVIRREVGDRTGEGRTLNNLGYLAASLDDNQQALEYYEQALVILREASDRAGEGTTLQNLGNLGLLADSSGDKAPARRYFEQALIIQREVGDRRGEGTTLNNLGMLASSLGQMDEARHYFEQALAIHREVGDRTGEGWALNSLGRLADSLGDKQQAHRYFEQALVIWREVGDRRMEGVVLNNLGHLADSVGEQEEAQRYFEQALDILRAVGDRQVEGLILNNLGRLADTLGEQEDALSYYEQALGIARELGDRRIEGVILNNLGLLTTSLDDTEDALSYYEQALLIRREVGDRPGEGTTLNNLGYLAKKQGQKETARAYYEQALEIFRAVGAVDNARTTEENIRALDNVSDAPAPAEKPRRRWPWHR